MPTRRGEVQRSLFNVRAGAVAVVSLEDRSCRPTGRLAAGDAALRTRLDEVRWLADGRRAPPVACAAKYPAACDHLGLSGGLARCLTRQVDQIAHRIAVAADFENGRGGH